jgi:hypothetical protein
MTQTELNFGKVELTAPYNGLFYCHIRDAFFRWPEFISFLKEKRL